MKTYLLMVVAIACVCACSPPSSCKVAQQPTNQYVFREETLPPSSEPEMSLTERKLPDRTIVILNEEIEYRKSLDNIRKTFMSELSAIEQCERPTYRSHYWAPWASTDSCSRIVKDVCAVDELIDTRWTRHRKPYCTPAWRMRLK